MLKRLAVSNFAIVEKAEVGFADGLNVITGETGAGKSVLMGALELVVGGRADPGVVREGAKEAEVEADFGDVVVRRTVTAQGRSRAWVNDESVTIGELRELVGRRVDIHGARANQNLLEERFQRETLDAYGSIDVSGYAACWQKLRTLREDISRLTAAGTGEDEADLLRYQVGEIEAANLTDKDETLAERHAAAAHAGEIARAASAASEWLSGDSVSAAEALLHVRAELASLARHVPEAADWAETVEDMTGRINELSRAVAEVGLRAADSDEDFDALDRRLGLVNRLVRKYVKTSSGEGAVASLMAVCAEKKERLDEVEHRGERLAALEAAAAEAEGQVRRTGAALTKKRRKAAEKLGAAVTKELRDLGFLQSRFSVAVEPAEPESHGCDRIVYVFEPNPGEPARPLAEVASSGETARVMLAVKGVLAVHDAADVLVFDEIDANVGGEVGRIVGEKLRGVAQLRQVITITHLPQSAAFGERHLVVSKAVSGGRTRTSISAVEGAARVAELARMLGGETSTTVVRKHAEELLRLSR